MRARSRLPNTDSAWTACCAPAPHKLSGILNGVDYEEWNPETDPHLPANYSAADLSGKRACKKALLEEIGLPLNTDRPLIGIVSRFADQKGFDLVGDIAGCCQDQNVAMAVLGSGRRRFEDMFRQLAACARKVRACGSATTTRWRTASRPAPTCS